nr:RNA-directed DNA polymerase, eukaryota, reverse transcriptase zinc-binding domain protein [Tanacetum cinerariifolium]
KRREEDNKNHGVNLPPLLAAHPERNDNGQPLQSTLTSAYGGHQPSNNSGGNLPPNGICSKDRSGFSDACRLWFHFSFLVILLTRENMGFDLTKSNIFPSFVEDHTAKGVELRVVDSYTGKYGLRRIISIGNGNYVFKFNNESGLQTVIESGVWIVNNKPMVVQKRDIDVDINKIEPNIFPVWVKMVILPLEA